MDFSWSVSRAGKGERLNEFPVNELHPEAVFPAKKGTNEEGQESSALISSINSESTWCWTAQEQGQRSECKGIGWFGNFINGCAKKRTLMSLEIRYQKGNGTGGLSQTHDFKAFLE